MMITTMRMTTISTDHGLLVFSRLARGRKASSRECLASRPRVKLLDKLHTSSLMHPDSAIHRRPIRLQRKSYTKYGSGETHESRSF